MIDLLVNEYNYQKIKYENDNFNFIPDGSIFYLSGFEFEDYVEKVFDNFLIKNIPNKKTGDYGIDLFVDEFNNNYGIQIKHYRLTKIGVKDIQQTYAGAKFYDVKPILLSIGMPTEPALKIANKLGVEIINGVDLMNWHNIRYAKRHKDKNSFYFYVSRVFYEIFEKKKEIIDDYVYYILKQELKEKKFLTVKVIKDKKITKGVISIKENGFIEKKSLTLLTNDSLELKA